MTSQKIVTPSYKITEELDKFTDEQLKLIFENTYAINLTEGCSNCCDFCGYEAPLGVRDIIPYETLEIISEKMYSLTTKSKIKTNYDTNSIFKYAELMLYSDTDPLDWNDKTHNYFDVLKLFSKKEIKCLTVTAIPKSTEQLAMNNLDKVNGISISHMNRQRLIPHFERLGIDTYIDIYNYKKFKGEISPNEPFNFYKHQVKVEGTIEETLNQLRQTDPSLPKKARFYDLRQDGNPPHIDVQNNNNLFLFCKQKTDSKTNITDIDYQGVVNSGRNFDETNIKEYEYFSQHHGVIISPTGFYNLVSIPPTKQNPCGRLIEQITPDNFNVVKLDIINNYLNPNDCFDFHYIT